MSERRSFYRKIAYFFAICVLLFPLTMLSTPATLTEAGGRLAQLRDRYGLGQANMGEVDPASETIRLATLGLRGVAVNLLWEKANYYKKTEDWTNLTATLEQLAKLQPNFVTFWKFQAWNLSYNVSVEFDNYRDRYYFVRRGIEFLKEGERYNVDNPQLLSDLGWFIGQKIGRADEHVQYRRLFKADDDYHPPDRPPEQRDNWLVGKQWYLKSVDAVDNRGKSIGRKSPRIFYSAPAMSQMNYASAIEKEGLFERARQAWKTAFDEWEQFGRLVIEHSTGVKLRLGEQAQLEQRVEELVAELEALRPGVRDEITASRLAALTDEERQALDTPYEERTPTQQQLADNAERQTRFSYRDVAGYIAKNQPELAKQAHSLASELQREELTLRYTINYKNDSNYKYWLTRAKMEQSDDAIAARIAMFEARRAFRDEGDVVRAKQLFEDGFLKWRRVFDTFPYLVESDSTAGDDLIDYIVRYRDVLDQLDETFPEDFPLWDILDEFDTDRKFREELSAYYQREDAAAARNQPESNP